MTLIPVTIPEPVKVSSPEPLPSGANIKAIYKAENRELFKKEMDKVGIETARGGFAKTSKEAD